MELTELNDRLRDNLLHAIAGVPGRPNPDEMNEWLGVIEHWEAYVKDAHQDAIEDGVVY
jgi:hypothetical protein